GPEPHQAALLSGGVDAGVVRSAVGVAAAADLVGEAAVGTAQLEGPRAERRGVAEREMLPAGARGLLGGGGPGGGVVARRLTLGAQSWRRSRCRPRASLRRLTARQLRCEQDGDEGHERPFAVHWVAPVEVMNAQDGPEARP